MTDAKKLVLQLIMYASDHQDQYPTNINDTTNYWNNADGPMTFQNQFDLVFQGPVSNVTDAANTIAVRGKEPWLQNGKWVKAYGFVDGHSVIMAQPPEGFDAWEQQHIAPPPNGQ